jgi:hypothetical protein
MLSPRYWFWAGVCVLAVFSTGCNLLEIPFFILGPEPKVPPLLHRIAPKEKEKETTAVILVASNLETRTELIRSDRDLALLLTQHLRDACKYNEEKVKVVPASKVDNFKSEHPDWQKWDLLDIGRHFRADWVIYLEINDLSLYEKGSSNTLFRGRAQITVSLVDVKHPEEVPLQKDFTGQYPGEAKPPVEVNDSNSWQFRRAFLDYMAEQLAWYFTAHPTNKDYSCR